MGCRATHRYCPSQLSCFFTAQFKDRLEAMRDVGRSQPDRIMSCPLGTISKRSRLEIRLEHRLEYAPTGKRRLCTAHTLGGLRP
jgi:hypothetical protein